MAGKFFFKDDDMDILKCPNCDAPLEGGEQLCSSCGKELDTGNGQPAVKKGRNKVFGVLAVLLVLVGGVALMMFTGVIPNPLIGRGTAAIVNGEKISWKNVDQKVEMFAQVYARSGAGAPDFSTPEGKKVQEAMRQQVLNTLIQEQVLLTEAKREKLTVSSQEIQERIDAIRKGMNLSDKDFEAFLKSHAMNMENLRKRLENELLINKLIEKGAVQKGLSREEWFQQVNGRASVKIYPRGK